ncbi:glycosyltransferase family 4 protein, partial [Prosthecobacter sp.]|uniref:glycosyltransferase family 4 protein n=1 Tax=Prosthecobacter sp. TaxID=1965333 RepID=UPI001D2EF286
LFLSDCIFRSLVSSRVTDAPASPLKMAIVAGGQNLFGKEIMALELGEGLRDRGHQVLFVSSLWCGDGGFGRRLQQAGIPAQFMRLGFISATLRPDCIRMTLDQLIRAPGLWLNYAGFLRRQRSVQVIHTNWHHLLMLHPFLKPERDWFWLHEVVPNKPQYRHVFRHLARHLRAFIPVSDAVKASLLEIGIPENKIHVIHNGIKDPVGTESTRGRSWQGGRIGVVGQIGEWKGHQNLLEAFGAIAGSHPDAELHLFGTGEQDFTKRLRQRAEQLGVGGRMVWHGFLSDRRQIYECIDLCAVPSRTADPLPTVAIEAAFFSLPVVASRIGGLPEIVEDGVSGFLHEAENQTELATHLQTLLSSEELRKRMGAAARRRAQICFSRGRFVADFEQLLRSPESFLQPPSGP